MNLLSYVYILTSFAFFESALAIFRLQRKSSLNRIAAFLLLWNAFYTLIRGLIPVAQTIIEAQTLASIMIVLLCFHGPIVFHFCAILAKLDPPPLRRILLVLLYTISLALAIWDALPPEHRTYWDDAFCALTLICWVAGGGLIIGRLRIATDRTEKKQLGILGGFSLAGFVSTVFVALRSNVYPDRNNPSTEMLPDWLILLGLSAVCLLGLRVAMQKYNSLTLHPKTPSGQIFSAMNSPVVMADAEGRIRYANCEAAWILSAAGRGDQILLGMALADLFENGDSLRTRMEILKEGKKYCQSCTLMLRAGCEKKVGLNGTGAVYPILLNMSIFPLFQDSRRLGGYLVLGSRAEGLVSLSQNQGLTPRETEILLFINEGFSTKEISEALFISELTAKTHIHRIYQKLKAKNRVDLTRMVKG